MKFITKLAGLLLVPAMLLSGTAHAALTAAGTAINNQASVSYDVGGTPFNKPSNTVTTTVAQITAVNIVTLNSPVSVTPGATGSAMAFKVTNTGNGADTFTLTANSAIAGDNFDPTGATIYADTNGNGVYDLATDVVAAATALLNQDAYATFFIVNSIPNTALDTQTGLTALKGTSQTAAGVAGTVTVGGGVGGVNVVVGAGGGTATTQGTYVVTSITVTAGVPGAGPFTPGTIPATYNAGEYMKFATVTDPYAGSEPIPGATITYTLIFSLVGTGTANNVILGDDIPTNTTYVGGSTKLSVDSGTTFAALADATVQAGGTTAVPYTPLTLPTIHFL